MLENSGDLFSCQALINQPVWYRTRWQEGDKVLVEAKGDYHWIKNAMKWYVNSHLCLSSPTAVHIWLDIHTNRSVFDAYAHNHLECRIIRNHKKHQTLPLQREELCHIAIHCYSEVCLSKNSKKRRRTGGAVQHEPQNSTMFLAVIHTLKDAI